MDQDWWGIIGGVAEAKAIAYAAHKPLIGVHHIEDMYLPILLKIRIWSAFCVPDRIVVDIPILWS